MKIPLVEDLEEIRKSLPRCLKRRGSEVAVFTDGQEGVDTSRERGARHRSGST